MSFHKKTIRDIDLAGKTVLLSADYNVPGDDSGKVTNDYRLKASLPTIHYLLDKHCKIVIISHRGRPEGKVVFNLSLRPVAQRLSKLLERPVQFANDCIGETAQKAVSELKHGEILVLENTRFHKEEEENNTQFGTELARQADVFVQDAFGNAHRAHASTVAVTKHLPAVAGLLLEKEIDTITTVMEAPERPLMAIIGGAKISDKIDVLNRFIDIADVVAVGGAMANTFLLAEDITIGKSLDEPGEKSLARDIIEKAREKAKKQRFIFYLPQDGVVADSTKRSARTRVVDWGTHVIASIENYPKRPPREDLHVARDELILDIGPFSGAFIAGSMQLANTVIWNGAMGVTETPSVDGPIGPFSHGTELVVEAMMGQFGHKPFSVVGGGDTVGYIEQRKLNDYFDHVSSGGGASLDLMSGKKLPAVEALQDKGH